MGLLKEFKSFAMKGNVVDMAVGVIIGSAFGKIVSSLVANIITPLLGVMIGGVNFKDLKIVLQEAKLLGSPAVTIDYGIFLQNVFDFLIIAFSIFMVIKLMNSLQRKEEEKPTPPAPEVTPADILLLTEIRDLLKK